MTPLQKQTAALMQQVKMLRDANNALLEVVIEARDQKKLPGLAAKARTAISIVTKVPEPKPRPVT
jgi:hypothetical protein